MIDDINHDYSILDIINKESKDLISETLESTSTIINFKEIFK